MLSTIHIYNFTIIYVNNSYFIINCTVTTIILILVDRQKKAMSLNYVLLSPRARSERRSVLNI